MITSIRFQRVFLFCPTLSHSRRAKQAPTPFQKHSAVTRNLFLAAYETQIMSFRCCHGKKSFSVHVKTAYLIFKPCFTPLRGILVDLVVGFWLVSISRCHNRPELNSVWSTEVVMFLTLPPLAPLTSSAKGSTISLTEPGPRAKRRAADKTLLFYPKGIRRPHSSKFMYYFCDIDRKKHQSAEVQLFFLCRRAPAPSDLAPSSHK